jgi:hypothetical protein
MQMEIEKLQVHHICHLAHVSFMFQFLLQPNENNLGQRPKYVFWFFTSNGSYQ